LEGYDDKLFKINIPEFGFRKREMNKIADNMVSMRTTTYQIESCDKEGK
jgi:hypothetical protein